MMNKSYADYMNDISSDELYEGLLSYGFFADKLPPIFTSKRFFAYCQQMPQPFSAEEHDFVYFESMRNTNVPRALGIPTPMAYQRLCAVLRDSWTEIQRFLGENTKKETYKISRIHIRKRNNSRSLFEMNYQNWQNDGLPFPERLIGKKYMVCADISTCFPSIYTHSIPWALLGKDAAKKKRTGGWQNDIDQACQHLRNGETHGLLIGPHASNLLSEIILTTVDRNLSSERWDYIRNIDDYTCYVSSREDADRFLKALSEHLRYFDLTLNHKKTVILELPIAAAEQWVRQLNNISLVTQYGKVSYKLAQAYLDAAVKLMTDNNMNSAVLKYAIKVLAKQEMSGNAKEYCAKQIMHLALIYPYLLPLLDSYVFEAFSVEAVDIAQFSKLSYSQNQLTSNYEGMYYSIYYALKYGFDLSNNISTDAISSENCLLKLFAWLYCKRHADYASLKKLKEHAKQLKTVKSDLDRNWIFIYESLTVGLLSGEWKTLKAADVSFIDQKYL